MLLSWVGGKSKLAEQIISIFPPHKKYIEPFFGGGWIFFKKQPAQESIINDINDDLINLYRVVRDCPQELARLINYTPRHESEFAKFQALFLDKEQWKRLSDVKRALIYYFLVKVAFNSNPLNIFGMKMTWGGDGMLETMEKVSEKLQSAIICNRDYKELFKYVDKDTLMYLDPPYAVTLDNGSEMYYENILGLTEHQVLMEHLTNPHIKFKWVMSYDVHPLVEKLYGGLKGIHMFETSKVFQSSINKHSRFVDNETYDTAFKSEYLITNFPIIESLPLFADQEAPHATESST